MLSGLAREWCLTLPDAGSGHANHIEANSYAAELARLTKTA